MTNVQLSFFRLQRENKGNFTETIIDLTFTNMFELEPRLRILTTIVKLSKYDHDDAKKRV